MARGAPSYEGTPGGRARVKFGPGSELSIVWDVGTIDFPHDMKPSDVIKNTLQAIVAICNEEITVSKFTLYGSASDFENIMKYITLSSTVKGPFKVGHIDCEHYLVRGIGVTVLILDNGALKRGEKGNIVGDHIIADMFAFAWDTSKRTVQNPGIVLLSSSAKFGYSLELLRARDTGTILIHGEGIPELMKLEADYAVEWYNISRGLIHQRLEEEAAAKPRDWIAELEFAIDFLFSNKLDVTDQTIRTQMKLDGRSNDSTWNKVITMSGAHTILHAAREDRESMKDYDPSKVSWRSFVVEHLLLYYNVLLGNPGLSSNGKFALTQVILHVIHGWKKTLVGFAVDKVMEFVELSTRQGWIHYNGRTCRIEEGLPPQFPFAELFQREKDAEDIKLAPKSKVLRKQAKSALQFYYAKHFRLLPTYETTRVTRDGKTWFVSKVTVPLPQGTFAEASFNVEASETTKKEAELSVALMACEMIETKYHIRGFEFPENYVGAPQAA